VWSRICLAEQIGVGRFRVWSGADGRRIEREWRGRGKIWKLEQCHCLRETNDRGEKRARGLFVQCDGLR